MTVHCRTVAMRPLVTHCSFLRVVEFDILRNFAYFSFREQKALCMPTYFTDSWYTEEYYLSSLLISSNNKTDICSVHS